MNAFGRIGSCRVAGESARRPPFGTGMLTNLYVSGYQTTRYARIPGIEPTKGQA
jgi:hypothetical protein